MTEFYPEGKRFERALSAFGPAVVVSGLAWAAAYRDLPVFAALLTAVMLLVGIWLYRRPLRVIRLEQQAVVEYLDGIQNVSIAYSDVSAVVGELVLYGSSAMEIVGRSGRQIGYSLTGEGEEFTRQLGAKLVPFRSRIHAKKSIVKAMGWPEVPNQWD